MIHEVTLEQGELYAASQAGMLRILESIKDHRKDNHGFDGKDNWTIGIEGACAECAFAKFMGVYWNAGVNTFKAGDVGKFQIRWTDVDSKSLIVRDADADSDVYVLVTGRAPSYKIVGWIRGKDAKQSQYMRAPNRRPPAYFVPASDLREIPKRKS